jgi:hypothetical protein
MRSIHLVSLVVIAMLFLTNSQELTYDEPPLDQTQAVMREEEAR